MAEVFGVAASAVGVAGFAIQLAESVVKLKDFCRKVKDAPEELREVVESLQQSSKLLDHIAKQSPSFSAAKADLHYAYTIWSTSQLHVGQKQLAHDIASITLVQKITGPTDSEVLSVKAVGSICVRKPLEIKRDAQRYVLRLPTWLYLQAWEMSFQQAASGWNFCLRSYRILPKYGSGLSVFDRFEDGQTPLSVAVGKGQAELASFLLENGASSTLTAEPTENRDLLEWADKAQEDERHRLGALLNLSGYQTEGDLIQIMAKPLQQWSITEKLHFCKVQLAGRCSRRIWLHVARVQSDVLKG
ncbi:hypothetical protein EJ03DRAFT_354014 [Teratosphaeria nubilosa]|uniref:Uncharacterized protein n=1 Tax=Teratosphaeria nubilosa TaxID=161662 RepID=A0A6G1L0T2_9PEZI|nr:hypothetical protein EJ03DRAFT_354014 [Teratosphaeria nubilosa]